MRSADNGSVNILRLTCPRPRRRPTFAPVATRIRAAASTSAVRPTITIASKLGEPRFALTENGNVHSVQEAFPIRFGEPPLQGSTLVWAVVLFQASTSHISLREGPDAVTAETGTRTSNDCRTIVPIVCEEDCSLCEPNNWDNCSTIKPHDLRVQQVIDAYGKTSTTIG